MKKPNEMWVYFTPSTCLIGTPHCFRTYREAREDFLKLVERKEWKCPFIQYEEPKNFMRIQIQLPEGPKFDVNFQKVSK